MITETQYAPLFEGASGDVVFLPYEELMAPTKTEARAIGRAQRVVMLTKTGLNFAGRVKRLEPGIKWPRVPMPVEGHEDPLYLCPVEGPVAREIAEMPAPPQGKSQVETVST